MRAVYLFVVLRTAWSLRVYPNPPQGSGEALPTTDVNTALNSKPLGEVASLIGGTDQMCGANPRFCIFKDQTDNFTCGSGDVVSGWFVNDGVADCVDATDEFSQHNPRDSWYMSHYFTIKSVQNDISRYTTLGRRSYVSTIPTIAYTRGNDRVRVWVNLLLNLASSSTFQTAYALQNATGLHYPPVSHKGLGFRFEDKDTNVELSRMDLQVYAGVWTTTMLPLKDITMTKISRMGDLFDWSSNAIYTTFSKSYLMWSQDWRKEVQLAKIKSQGFAHVVDIAMHRTLTSTKYWLPDIRRQDKSLAAPSYACEKLFDRVMREVLNISLYGDRVARVVEIGAMHVPYKDLRMIDLREPDSRSLVLAFYDRVQHTFDVISSANTLARRLHSGSSSFLKKLGVGSQDDVVTASVDVVSMIYTLHQCYEKRENWAGPTFYRVDESPYDVSDTPVKYYWGRCGILPYTTSHVATTPLYIWR